MGSISRRGKLRRALALSAAAGILVLAGPAIPASAQPAAPPWAPPPVDPYVSMPWSGPLRPNERIPGDPGDYTQKQGCVQPSAGSTTISQEPWAQQVLGIDQLHTEGWTGAGHKIAVIDTGINPHPLLPPVDAGGGSAVPDGRSADFDCDGHGTIVAGILAARRDPVSGFVGVAPNAALMSLRYTSELWQSASQQGKTPGNTATMAQAINYAVGAGATVINLSQASCQPLAQAQSDLVYDQELQAAVYNAWSHNVVVVAAAGNSGEGGCNQNTPGNPTTAVLPAWYSQYVLSVASVNQQGAPSQFSIAGPWVGVAAPGEDITSVDPAPGGTSVVNQVSQPSSTGESGQMGPIQGTSFAAPYVAGLAALIQQKFASEGRPLTAQQVIDRIEQTAQHPGGPGGRNDIVGYGMINPDAALNDILVPGHPPRAPARLPSNAIPHTYYPAILVAIGVAGIGVAAVVFTAFLLNAIRHARRARESRTAASEQSSPEYPAESTVEDETTTAERH